jgi:chromosome partitioning protein
MAYFLAVANRKGGVGKSTITVMLAHGLSVWGGKRVLIIDLDSQCNASMILLGGEGWVGARAARRTVADYLSDSFSGKAVRPSNYVLDRVGDVVDASGRQPHLSVLPGSLLLDDVQGELFLLQANNRGASTDISMGLRERLIDALRRFEHDFDVIILDCAPGLSFAALAGLKIANKVVVPFRADYVSLLAVDRVALIIEERRDLDDLAQVPLSRRRYACLANFVRDDGRERLLIEEIGLAHPVFATELPQRDGIANSFDWLAQSTTIEEKYGEAVRDVRSLYDEIIPLLRR